MVFLKYYLRRNLKFAWLFAAGLVAVCVLVLLKYGADKAAERKANTLIASLQKRLAETFVIGRSSVSSSHALLEDISLKGTKAVTIKRIEAQINPLAIAVRGSIISRVAIDRADLTLTVPQLTQWLTSGQASTASSPYLSPKLAFLPAKFTLEHSHLLILDEAANPLIELKDARLSFDKTTNSADFRVSQLLMHGQTIAENTKGNLTFDPDKKSLRLLFRDLELSHLKADLLSLTIEPKTTSQNTAFAAKVTLSLNKALVFHELLSADAVGPLAGDITASLALNPRQRILNIDLGKLTLKNQIPQARPFKIYFDGIVTGTSQKPIINVTFDLPSTRCQQLLDITPKHFAPVFKDFSLVGKTSFKINLDVPLSEPDQFIYGIDHFNFNCAIAKTAAKYSGDRLNYLASSERANELGRTFTRVENLSPNFKTALLSAEDISFYSHQGFEFQNFEVALRRNLKQGHIMLGGSTISMQLAKNLFLEKSKTISRKLQEALLTWNLEESLSKNKILETYVNLVEYGPEIVGIEKASQHFFGKAQANLSLLEATYLVALLPNPHRRYNQFCRGKLSDGFKDMLRGRLGVMLSVGKISEDQYESALADEIRFNEAERNRATNCNKSFATIEKSKPDTF